jgi:ribosomal protein S8
LVKYDGIAQKEKAAYDSHLSEIRTLEEKLHELEIQKQAYESQLVRSASDVMQTHDNEKKKVGGGVLVLVCINTFIILN